MRGLATPHAIKTKFYRGDMIAPVPDEPTQVKTRTCSQIFLEELQEHGPGGGIVVTTALCRCEGVNRGGVIDVDGESIIVKRAFLLPVFLTDVFAATPTS